MSSASDCPKEKTSPQRNSRRGAKKMMRAHHGFQLVRWCNSELSMDLVSLNEMLCNPFYEQRPPASDGKNVRPGQLAWAHVVYPAAKVQSLELVSLNRTDGAKSTFRITDYTAGANPDFPV